MEDLLQGQSGNRQWRKHEEPEEQIRYGEEQSGIRKEHTHTHQKKRYKKQKQPC